MAQAELHGRAEYYRALIENSQDLILVLNRDGTARYASPSAERILGYTAADLEEMRELRLVHPDDTGLLLGAIEQALGDDASAPSIECRVRHRNGSWRLLSGSGKALPGSAEAPGVVVNARDVTEERRAVDQIRRRDAILEAVGFAAERFLRFTGWEESVPATLARLGVATSSSRVYLFERLPGDTGPARLRQRFEWVGEGVESQLGNAELEDFSFAEVGLERWETAYWRNESVYANIADLPEEVRGHFESQDIRSLVSVPVFVDGAWWGVLGFDECEAEREWLPAEREALRVAADTLGAAVQRQRADSALREREEQFRFLAELMPQLVWTTTPEGYHDYYNQRWYDYTGMPREGAQGFNWKNFLHSDDYGRAVEVWQHSLDTGEPYQIEYRFKQASDGQYRWFIGRALPLRDSEGVIIRWFGTCTDVHDEREVRDALGESEQRFRALVENLEEVIAVVNADGTVRYLSPAFERVAGIPPEERIGHHMTERVHPEDQEMVRSEFRRLLDEPGPLIRIEPRLRHRNGSWRTVELVGQNLLHDPAVHGVVMTYRDVTETRQLEEQLRQAQKMESVGRLAGGIAHDFNNLLMVIDGNTRFVLDDLPPDVPAREDLDEVRKACEKAASLTQQLLAFSRKQVLQPDLLDLNEVVSTIEKMLRRTIGEDLELTTSLAPEPMLVHADPARMNQVLINLAINARDSMPDGGTLRVSIGHAQVSSEEAAGFSHESAPGEYAVLTVEDTGCGMDQATVTQIFEPFFTTKGHGKGTGLGLSTVYGIVKQSDGHIRVHSKPGAGTKFEIYLPLAEESDTAEGLHHRNVERHQGGGEIVLVVEDEAAVGQVTRRVLQRGGYEVLLANSAEEAFELVERYGEKIDLVLTDVVMPRVSGRELVVRLRERFPDMRVLYMSGYTDDALLHHGVRASDEHFLQKPASPAAILKTVAVLLAAR